jgi:hypothetical protein
LKLYTLQKYFLEIKMTDTIKLKDVKAENIDDKIND